MATPRKSPGTIADAVEVSEYKGGKIVEKRTTIKNDDGITSPTPPKYYETGSLFGATTIIHKGKFFPRGCRGHLINLEIYCKGSGTTYLAYSPQPSMGGEVITITPDPDWSWKSVTIEKFWNYDSLFIWVMYALAAVITFGYDEEKEHDGYTSDDDGATWSKENRRYFIRASIIGQTVGDLPVSGTVNVIEIPSVIAVQTELTISVAQQSESGATIRGSGETILIEWYANTVGERDNIRPRIRVDGADVLPHDISFSDWYTYYTGLASSGEGIYFTRYDETNHHYNFRVCLRVPFRRKIEIIAYNASATTGYTIMMSYILKRLI